MSRPRSRRAELPPPQETIEKLEKMVDGGDSYTAQQMYKSMSARYTSAEKYSEALDVLESGSLVQLQHGQVTCGAELAVLFVETLVKGKFSCTEDILDRIRKFYDNFPKNFDGNDNTQKFSEDLTAADIRIETCSSFLRAAIKWSAEFGSSRNGSPRLHDMLAEYLYSESPELDMAKISYHFVRGCNPEKFASVLVNFMGKCDPGEDDMTIARAVLFYLSQGNLRDANKLMDELKKQPNFPDSDLIQFIGYLLRTLERDAFPLFKILRQKYKSIIERESLFNALLDVIAEKFYGVRRSTGLEGLFGDLFKMM